MIDKIKEPINGNYTDMAQIGAKISVGFGGAFTAMSINDIAALIVAILTGIYMCFQIEAAWRKRKEATKEKDQ